jgi:hypothetical protein
MSWRMPGNLHFLPIPAFQFAPANWKERGSWMNRILEQNASMVRYRKCSGRFEEEEANYATG